jgi:hypothetical protein
MANPPGITLLSTSSQGIARHSCLTSRPRPWRAVRAATAIRSRRMVAAWAFAWRRLARVPPPRRRLQAMATMASQAALALNFPDGTCASGPSYRSAKELLDDRVAAVLFLGVDQLVMAVGEDDVIAPGGKQLAVAWCGLSLVADAADDEPGGDLQLFLLGGEGGVAGLRDLGVGDPAARAGRPRRPAGTRWPATRHRESAARTAASRDRRTVPALSRCGRQGSHRDLTNGPAKRRRQLQGLNSRGFLASMPTSHSVAFHPRESPPLAAR